jgi:hypothetical protein
MRDCRYFLRVTTVLFAVASVNTPLRAADTTAAKPGLDKVGHIVVLFLENHGFDNLYGLFPGANGIGNSDGTSAQTDLSGRPFDKLPRVMNVGPKGTVVDNRFPDALANAPFRADEYAGLEQTTGDLVHRFYQQQAQINGGKMDHFAVISDGGGLTMGYYDGSRLPMWDYAKRYALLDNFFHAAFGGSFLNHMFLVCACAPRYQAAPGKIRAILEHDGTLAQDGAVTPDGYAINTLLSAYPPHPKSVTDQTPLLPPLEEETIGDRLDKKGIKWAWYSGLWLASCRSGGACSGVALAAVLGHVSEQRIHDRIGRRVDQRPALASEGHEVRVFELAQVERQRRGRESEPLADATRRQPFRSGLHKQPENIEPRLVTERNEGGYGFRFFHSSNMMEI